MQPNSTPRDENIPEAIASLARLLLRELLEHNRVQVSEPPASATQFAHWYLQVVQLLEAQVAGDAGVQPITREEVELMGRCALSGRDLHHAMQLCRQYCNALYPRAGRVSVVRRGDTAAFHLDSLRATVTNASSLSDITGLFAFFQLFQWLIGVDLQLQQVRIGPVNRDDVLPFLKLFGAPVLVGAPQYALELPVAVLDLPVVRTAAEFEQFFEVYPCNVFHNTVNDLAEQVAVLLSASARRRAGLPRQAQVARSLGLPLSTFRRRLRAAGKTFQMLRDECLSERAQQLLVQGDYSIADIAAQLGYSDAASFRRAFRQWHGDAPAVWRQRVAHG